MPPELVTRDDRRWLAQSHAVMELRDQAAAALWYATWGDR